MPFFEHKTIGRVLFVHIPKTGGSSVELWLKGAGYNLHRICNWNGAEHQHAPARIYNTWGEFDYKFTVVRHPMTRFLSALSYRGANSDNIDQQARDILQKYQQNKLPHSWGNHLLPQVEFLSKDLEIFRMEDDFFLDLSKRLDIPVGKNRPHTNKSSNIVTASDLSLEVRQKVQELYKDDYKALGYETED